MRRLLRKFIVPPLESRGHKTAYRLFMTWLYPPARTDDRYHFQGPVAYGPTQLIKIETTNWVGWNIFAFGEYSPGLVRVIRAVVKPGMTAVDVGANIGDVTLKLAEVVGERGEIYAFEPFPNAYEFLEDNLRLNNLSNVMIFQTALSDKPGRQTLHSPIAGTGTLPGVGTSGLTGMSSLARPSEPYMEGTAFNEYQVDVDTLDGFVQKRGIQKIDFIKIDAEGFDANVLQGGVDTITRDKPYIVFELDPVLRTRSGKSPEDIVRLLPGYQFYLISNKPERPLTSVEKLTESVVGDLFAVPSA